MRRIDTPRAPADNPSTWPAEAGKEIGADQSGGRRQDLPEGGAIALLAVAWFGCNASCGADTHLITEAEAAANAHLGAAAPLLLAALENLVRQPDHPGYRNQALAAIAAANGGAP